MIYKVSYKSNNKINKVSIRDYTIRSWSLKAPPKTKSLSSLRSLTVFAFLFPYENEFSTDPKRQSPVACATRLFDLRRKRDSNPRFRISRTTDFESAPFDHSGISPVEYPNLQNSVVMSFNRLAELNFRFYSSKIKYCLNYVMKICYNK